MKNTRERKSINSTRDAEVPKADIDALLKEATFVAIYFMGPEMIEITSPILTSVGFTDLVVDQDGNPVIQITFVVEEENEFDMHENTFHFYMNTLEASRLVLSMIKVCQQGIKLGVKLTQSMEE